MNSRGRFQRLAILAIIPALALVFWLTAVIASDLPRLVVVGVNVHGLNLASFDGDPGQRPAPLSISVLDDARRDAGTPTPAPRVTPTPTPSRIPDAPTAPKPPTATPTPTPIAPVVNPTPTPGSATIRGQVTDDQTRLPIVAATVSVSPGGTSVLTDANGNFSVTVQPGTYTVTASAINYDSASQTVGVNSGQEATLAFRLARSIGNLTGTVTDDTTKAPIVGATVTLSNGLIRVTDINGNFSYTAVLSGDYTLTVSAIGYVTQSLPVSVRGGRTTTVQIGLMR